MPRETPTIHFGDIARYQRRRKRSGLSRDALLAEQDKMEREIVKAAAKRGVKLKGAVADKRREDGRRAAAAAERGKRERAAAAAAAAVPVEVAYSSRGRPLREKRRWPDD